MRNAKGTAASKTASCNSHAEGVVEATPPAGLLPLEGRRPTSPGEFGEQWSEFDFYNNDEDINDNNDNYVDIDDTVIMIKMILMIL